MITRNNKDGQNKTENDVYFVNGFEILDESSLSKIFGGDEGEDEDEYGGRD